MKEEHNVKKDNKTRLSEQQLQERLDLITQADEVTGEQLIVQSDGELRTEHDIKTFALGDIDDPDKRHDLYYNGIEKLLKRFLPPKSKTTKKYRKKNQSKIIASHLNGNKKVSFDDVIELIREEKNVFLSRGARKNSRGIRGADARMAYIGDLEKALQIIVDWRISDGNYVDLYMAFYNKNLKLEEERIQKTKQSSEE